MVSHNLQLN